MRARPMSCTPAPGLADVLMAAVLAAGGDAALAATAADGPRLAVGVAGHAVLDPAARDAFETALAQGFAADGFARVDSAWCTTAPCAPAGDHVLTLDVAIGTLRHAEIERGFAFTLGGPREAGRIEGDVVAIDCRLRTPAGRLVAARQVDQPVDPARLGDGAYLADRVGNACAALLDEQRVVVLEPAPRRHILPTADPDVFIEKRQVAADAPAVASGVEPVGAAAASEAGTSAPAATIPAALAAAGGQGAATDANAPRLARQRDGERTQYVLHNKGDTVIFEFGQRR